MRKELGGLKPFIYKFTLSSQKLDMILETQQAVFNKAGLGFRSYSKQKLVNNLYKKLSNENMTCFYYGKLGHKSYVCNLKGNVKSKQIWIIKGSMHTNHEGPKKAWVLKITLFVSCRCVLRSKKINKVGILIATAQDR